jgi:hypothetical protein
MSSVTSSFAQIAGRVKFFLAVADLSGCVEDGLSTVSVAVPSPSFNIAGGSLLKDLGRQIVVVDATTGGHLKTYRQVQVMDGATSEGVSGSAPDGNGSYYNTAYVLVSSADAAAVVKVVRTG